MPPSVGRMPAAEQSMRLLSERIRDADLPSATSPLVAESARLVEEASRRLHRLRLVFSGRNDRERRRQVIATAALVDTAREIDSRAAAVLG